MTMKDWLLQVIEAAHRDAVYTGSFEDWNVRVRCWNETHVYVEAFSDLDQDSAFPKRVRTVDPGSAADEIIVLMKIGVAHGS